MKKNLIKVITNAMLDKKAKDVVSLDLKAIGTAITDHFVICNADSTTAVAAIADNVLTKMKQECDRKVVRMQGLENNFWIILDFSDVVVHIFLTEYREFYRLEDLWADAKRKEYKDSPIKDKNNEDEKKVKLKSTRKLRSTIKNNIGE